MVGAIRAVSFALEDVHLFVSEPVVVAWDTKLDVHVQGIDYMPFDRVALVGADFLSFQKCFPSIPAARVDLELADFGMVYYSYAAIDSTVHKD